MPERRLFVGNLPNDVSESTIEKLFGKYEVSKIEVKRKKVLDEESVFAFVNISAKHVDKCLSELRDKKWKDSHLKVELAKESFLDRLKKEHSEKDQRNDPKSNGQITSNSFQLRQNFNKVKNKKIKFDSDNELEESDSNAIDKSPEDVPRRRNLPMFRGTTSVVTTHTKSVDSEAKPNSNKRINVKSSISEANSTMKSFEAFSDVWKDEPVLRNSYDRKEKALKWKSAKFNEENTLDNRYKSDDEFHSFDAKQKYRTSVSQSSAEYQENYVADNVFENRQHVRGDDKKEKILKWKSPKFSEEETLEEKFPDDNEVHSFDVKQKHKTSAARSFDNECQKNDVAENIFENRQLVRHDDKKEKMLKWKSSKFSEEKALDDRFKLKDKFFDDDEVHLLDAKQKRKTSVSRSFEDKCQKNGVAKNVFEHRQLVRYDPTRPEHKILEINSSESGTPMGKKKAKKNPEKHKTEQINKQKQTSEPVNSGVSKEKHYAVADTLVNAFKKTDNPSEFRLSSLFDEKIKQENPSLPKQIIAEEVLLNKAHTEDSIQRDSSSEDDEELEEPPVEILPARASEKVLGKCGVWGETFFFKEDDSRFKEAIDFFRPEDKKKIIDFDKQRMKLRTIVRKKLQNSKRDSKLFRQKLGDKLNKSKFKMRLKKARSC